MFTILITGGAGFIGSNLVKYIYEKYPNYKILVLDALNYAGNTNNIPDEIIHANGRFVFWHGDVQNPSLVENLIAQSNAVVHLAAETHVTRSIFDNFHFFETDVLGTQVVANAVLKFKKNIERFIHISTSEVYGTALTPLMDEEHPLLPASPYAAAKSGADRLVYSYWYTYGIPAVILRPFNNFGPHQHLEKLVPRFITSCILDEPLTVHGDGKSRRDWVYVQDSCKAIDKALHAPLDKVKGQVINIGSSRDLSIVEIATKILDRMNKPANLINYIGNRPGQVVRHTASAKKAEELLGWKADTDFDFGLDKTIEWYEKNKSWWERQLWMRCVPLMTADGKVEYH